jgi:hypothetical protein
MSKRLGETTDDQLRDLADAMGTWKPDAYHQARQAIVNDARFPPLAGPSSDLTRDAWR